MRSEWERLFTAQRSYRSSDKEAFIRGCEAAYKHQQSKIDELQKKNAWLSDVAERENKRANKLQEEKVSTTTLLGKTIQEKNELQKRVDAALKETQHALRYVEEDMRGNHEFLQMAMIRTFKSLAQALKGGEV